MYNETNTKLVFPCRHKAIQHFIEAFEYNFTGENFFNVKVGHHTATFDFFADAASV